MEYLNWMADHWLLTIVLFMIVFGNIGLALSGYVSRR